MVHSSKRPITFLGNTRDAQAAYTTSTQAPKEHSNAATRVRLFPLSRVLKIIG